MKKLLAGSLLALCAFTGAANAALVLHVEDVVATPGSTGSFDVYLEETGTEEAIQAYNVGLRLSPTGTVTFTGSGASNPDHPSLFLGQAPTDRTGSVIGYTAGNDIYLTDDFVVGGNAANAPVDNEDRNGLFRVNFSVPANATPGEYAVTVDPAVTALFDAEANDVLFTIDSGSITVVPEPAALSLLAGVGLLALRRRRA